MNHPPSLAVLTPDGKREPAEIHELAPDNYSPRRKSSSSTPTLGTSTHANAGDRPRAGLAVNRRGSKLSTSGGSMENPRRSSSSSNNPGGRISRSVSATSVHTLSAALEAEYRNTMVTSGEGEGAEGSVKNSYSNSKDGKLTTNDSLYNHGSSPEALTRSLSMQTVDGRTGSRRRSSNLRSRLNPTDNIQSAQSRVEGRRTSGTGSITAAEVNRRRSSARASHATVMKNAHRLVDPRHPVKRWPDVNQSAYELDSTRTLRPQISVSSVEKSFEQGAGAPPSSVASHLSRRASSVSASADGLERAMNTPGQNIENLTLARLGLRPSSDEGVRMGSKRGGARWLSGTAPSINGRVSLLSPSSTASLSSMHSMQLGGTKNSNGTNKGSIFGLTEVGLAHSASTTTALSQGGLVEGVPSSGLRGGLRHGLARRSQRIEAASFPGYSDSGPTPLPGVVDARLVMSVTVAALAFASGKARRQWLHYFLMPPSVDLMQDLFWWVFIHSFQHNTGIQERVGPRLYARVSESFVGLMMAVPLSKRDDFFTKYPDVLAATVYGSFCMSFPKSLASFGAELKARIATTAYEWVSGIPPATPVWEPWDAMFSLPLVQQVVALAASNPGLTTLSDAVDGGNGGSGPVLVAAMGSGGGGGVRLGRGFADIPESTRQTTLAGAEIGLGRVSGSEAVGARAGGGGGLSMLRQTSQASVVPRGGQRGSSRAERKTAPRESTPLATPRSQRTRFDVTANSPLVKVFIGSRDLTPVFRKKVFVSRTQPWSAAIANAQPNPNRESGEVSEKVAKNAGPTLWDVSNRSMKRSAALVRDYEAVCAETARERAVIRKGREMVKQEIDRAYAELIQGDVHAISDKLVATIIQGSDDLIPLDEAPGALLPRAVMREES